VADTARSMIASLNGTAAVPFHGTLRTVADSALLGAKGNSGAIVAQFLDALASEFVDEIRVTTRAFGVAAAVFAVVILSTGMVSLGSLAAGAAALIFYTRRSDIRRLIRGEENRFEKLMAWKRLIGKRR
jgi:hypothetical protein